MADEKKPDKPADKAPSPTPRSDPFVEIVWMMLGAFIVLYFINGLTSAVTSNHLFSNGWKGFTAQGILLSHTKPILSLSNPVGARVISTKDHSKVYNSPGGAEVGEHKFGDRGKILQGPVDINGERYWYVDYDSGPDGWVKESDIAYLESEPNLFEKILIWILSSVWYFKLFLIFLSIVIVACIVFLYRKLNEMRREEDKVLYPVKIATIENPNKNPAWDRVLNHIDSANESDWRLAILEADIILGEILEKLNLPGDTMGDKLKAVNKNDFNTINNAWEAHKIRNQIAHEGASFVLVHREARRVIELYRTIFEEFKVI